MTSPLNDPAVFSEMSVSAATSYTRSGSPELSRRTLAEFIFLSTIGFEVIVMILLFLIG